jgi:hypothetical protein
MTTMHSAAQHRGTANTGNDLFGDKSSPGGGDGDDGRNGFLSRWCHPMILEPDAFVSRVTLRRDSVRIPDFVCLSVPLLCGSVVPAYGVRTGTAIFASQFQQNLIATGESVVFGSRASILFKRHQSERERTDGTDRSTRYRWRGRTRRSPTAAAAQLLLLCAFRRHGHFQVQLVSHEIVPL